MRFDVDSLTRSFAGGLVVLSLAAPAAAQASSTPVDLGAGAFGVRINNDGVIAGWRNDLGYWAQPAIYRNGAWQALGIPSGELVGAIFGLNDLGAVAGFTYWTNSPPPYPNPNPPPVIDNRWRSAWAPPNATALQSLAVPPANSLAPPDSFLYAINSSGAMVGCRNRDDDVFPDPHEAMLVTAAGSPITDLSLPVIAAVRPNFPFQSGFDFTCARDINDEGVVVGEAQLQNQPSVAFRYENGNVTLLASGTGQLVGARAINEHGLIVGEGRPSPWSGGYHAFAYDSSTGTISSLGLEATGAVSSVAVAVNDHGDAVGYMTFGTSYPQQQRAFIATRGQVFDLNDLLPPGSGWVLEVAHSINNSGQIVGVGERTSSPGIDHGFALGVTITPVQLAENLIATVQGLEASGALNGGNANALVTKVEGAIQKIEAGQVATAVNKLEAFINQVEAFVQSGKLTAAQGQSLIAAAEGIITDLTS